MDTTPYGEELIDRWEKATGQMHKGHVEVAKGAILPYYDHRFVADLMSRVEKLHDRSEKLKQQFISLRDELRSDDGSTKESE